MTTESAQPSEADEPNEFGFAGDATAPEPEPKPAGDDFGESIAIPSGDLTGSIVAAMEPKDREDDD